MVLEAHLWVCFSSMMSENAKSGLFFENSAFWGYLGHRGPRCIRKMKYLFSFLKFHICERLRDPGIYPPKLEFSKNTPDFAFSDIELKHIQRWASKNKKQKSCVTFKIWVYFDKINPGKSCLKEPALSIFLGTNFWNCLRYRRVR